MDLKREHNGKHFWVGIKREGNESEPVVGVPPRPSASAGGSVQLM